jgi:hypothetical protein
VFGYGPVYLTIFPLQKLSPSTLCRIFSKNTIIYTLKAHSLGQCEEQCHLSTLISVYSHNTRRVTGHHPRRCKSPSPVLPQNLILQTWPQLSFSEDRPNHWAPAEHHQNPYPIRAFISVCKVKAGLTLLGAYFWRGPTPTC